MAEEIDPIERFYARYKADIELLQAQDGSRHHRIDWEGSWNADYSQEWLVDGLWPVGRHLHVFASAKTGKSLLQLWIAANLACGRDAFTGASIPARVVAYIDREMTEQDVVERLQDMDFEWNELENLHYYLYPAIAPLDTYEGGKELTGLVQAIGAQVVMLDTLSRVVKGEENSNDTYRNFHLYTGSMLKSEGVSLSRLDHEGHQVGHSRGASSKADDVDLIYQLQVMEQGLRLRKMAARVNMTRDEIPLFRSDDPLGFKYTGQAMWPAGVAEKAKEMDELGMPLEVTQREAISLFKKNGKSAGKTAVLAAAIRYRKWKLPIL